jgi:hypothetical protein
VSDNDVAVTPDVAAAPVAPDATPSHGAIDDTASSLRADIGRLAREGAEQGELNTALATVAAKGDNITLGRSALNPRHGEIQRCRHSSGLG